eukprot:Hpha_TRINITY_DN16150_c1_g2::TRINITY_DN16150_c1_g2_i1::g.3544::m.3544/K07964/HPSE; heparanase
MSARMLALTAPLVAAAAGVNVGIDGTTTLGVVEERFVSFGMDTSQLSQYGLSMAWAQPVFSALAAHLSPAYLRVGGTAGDKTYYDMRPQPGPVPPEYDWVLNASRFGELMTFAESAGFGVAFGVNAGPGPRGGKAGAWNGTNARELLEHVRDRGYNLSVLEFSNEPNLFPTAFGTKGLISGKQLAEDLRSFHTMAREVLGRGVRIAGCCDVAVQNPLLDWEVKPFLEQFWQNDAASYLDLFTYHDYPLISKRALPPALDPWGATVAHATDPKFLHQLDKRREVVEALRSEYAPKVPLWLGETAQSSLGGQAGVSSGFVDMFYYADTLGRSARAGVTVVVRQALAWSDYGIFDSPGTWTSGFGDDPVPVVEVAVRPRPDFWLAVLWKRLMGQRVLNATAAGADPTFIPYAHCTHADTSGRSATFLLLNLASTPRNVTLPPSSVGLYQLTAPGALTDKRVSLNGAELHATPDGELPPLRPVPAAPGLELPPYSVSFAVAAMPGEVAACK